MIGCHGGFGLDADMLELITGVAGRAFPVLVRRRDPRLRRNRQRRGVRGAGAQAARRHRTRRRGTTLSPEARAIWRGDRYRDRV